MSFTIENILKDNTKTRDRVEWFDLAKGYPSSTLQTNEEEEGNSSSIKRRIVFSKRQTWYLEKIFEQRPYLTMLERELLAHRIGATSNQIKIWFQNHRYKMKKVFKDIVQEQKRYEKRHEVYGSKHLNDSVKGSEIGRDFRYQYPIASNYSQNVCDYRECRQIRPNKNDSLKPYIISQKYLNFTTFPTTKHNKNVYLPTKTCPKRCISCFPRQLDTLAYKYRQNCIAKDTNMLSYRSQLQ